MSDTQEPVAEPRCQFFDTYGEHVDHTSLGSPTCCNAGPDVLDLQKRVEELENNPSIPEDIVNALKDFFHYPMGVSDSQSAQWARSMRERHSGLLDKYGIRLP